MELAGRITTEGRLAPMCRDLALPPDTDQHGAIIERRPDQIELALHRAMFRCDAILIAPILDDEARHDLTIADSYPHLQRHTHRSVLSKWAQETWHDTYVRGVIGAHASEIFRDLDRTISLAEDRRTRLTRGVETGLRLDRQHAATLLDIITGEAPQ